MFILSAIIVSCNSKKIKSESENINQNQLGSNFNVYHNDGLIKNVADPFVFKDDDGTYYLYHTLKGFKVYSSKDLINWTSLGPSMLKDGYKWAVSDFWATEVVKFKGKYYIHYTGQAADGIKRIGMAISDSPSGPFIDIDDKGFYSTPPKSVIDSHIFFDDDGKIYMYYSNAASSNKIGNQKASEIWVVQIKEDLLGTIGSAKKLTQPVQDWEYSPSAKMMWNEGTVVLKNKNIYYLMYSANCYCGSDYSVGYATSKSPLGPFVKYANNPILSNESVPDLVSGPGHHTVVKSPDNKELLIIYHSHIDLEKKGSERMMNIDRMGFREDGTMYVNGPTKENQLYPSSNKQGFMMIAKEANVSSMQTKNGYQINGLTDGEFSMYQRFEKYEWVATGEKATISFAWQAKKAIKEIWLYNSIVPNRQAEKAKLLIDDGTVIDNIGISKTIGKATIIKMPLNLNTKGFQLILEGNGSNTELGVSEIEVLSLNK
ncbi:hypothetical protein A5893_05050 [Pedobacter psychrophilus]|uniref:DUF7402 domain-containing protein n=2 Tax=Pedobacter psychrophilus TaxID=1826909 RepID=A0A179DHP6_9SPHI|nr:hypothetical protein A5893_05050 [Pedobacter psychrophilus]